MKLYRTYAEAQYGDGYGRDAKAQWTGTQADAAKARKYLNSTLKIPRDHIHTDEVDVPTDKKGLLAFLNQREA